MLVLNILNARRDLGHTRATSTTSWAPERSLSVHRANISSRVPMSTTTSMRNHQKIIWNHLNPCQLLTHQELSHISNPERVKRVPWLARAALMGAMCKEYQRITITSISAIPLPLSQEHFLLPQSSEQSPHSPAPVSRPKKDKQCNIVQLYFAEAPMPHCIHVPQFQPANALRGHLYQKVNKCETLQYHEWHEEANISNISNMLFMIVHVQLSECTLCAVSSALPHFQDVPWSLLERCRLQCHWPSRPSNRSWSWPAELPPPELMITPWRW